MVASAVGRRGSLPRTSRIGARFQSRAHSLPLYRRISELDCPAPPPHCTDSANIPIPNPIGIGTEIGHRVILLLAARSVEGNEHQGLLQPAAETLAIWHEAAIALAFALLLLFAALASLTTSASGAGSGTSCGISTGTRAASTCIGCSCIRKCNCMGVVVIGGVMAA
ncbi:uncharacterized protein Dmoj_GI26076 [Drosophila mojavensis]|uniref:Uncharacterized protein n=1 Tax=Drosophila mojavensis TaxID=7230 RepID=A0A0Q9XK58_DROMO|nr:uncharacterized protein Dmoj_GI26076 [Drosophila mojavensis]